jgi:hypothetical protein
MLQQPSRENSSLVHAAPVDDRGADHLHRVDGRFPRKERVLRLGNGARLDNIHAFADLSGKGRKSGYSVMVNYLYDTREIEANHEAYAERDIAASSGTVKNLLKQFLFRTQAAAKSNPEPDKHHAL